MNIYKYAPIFFLLSQTSFAAPDMGNLQAQERQLCGKSIEIQIAVPEKTHPGKLLLGLKNKQTGEIDLFLSSTNATDKKVYQHYDPVIFDALSGTFIPPSQPHPDISWGSSQNQLHITQYRLTLGQHVYTCTLPEQWPNKRANELYGEQD